MTTVLKVTSVLLNSVVSVFQTKMNVLLEAVRTKSESKAMEFKKSEEWATVEEMIAAHGKL